MTEPDTTAPVVTEVPEVERFELRLDGELAGFLAYRRRKTLIAFDHTEVDERFAGRGLAGKLVAGALDRAREEGLEVLPFCSYASGWIARHPDYVDLVPAGQRAHFELDEAPPPAER